MAHHAWHWLAGLVLLGAALLLGILVGSVTLTPHAVWLALQGQGDVVTRSIVWTLRAPRVCLALVVGAALGMSGTVIQGTLRNALAEPYLLGVSGGAAVGAVCAALGHVPAFAVPIAAFLGAASAVMLALAVARGASGTTRADARTLLMAGVVVGALANAVIMILLANAPPNMIRGALWWMMGSVGDATWRTVTMLAVYVAAGTIPLVLSARDLDVLTLGDDAATALGVHVERVTRRTFLCAALVAAVTVAAAGLIGFVGLIVPHLVRLGGMSRFRQMLPAAAIVGAILVVGSDIVARVALPPAELPLGAVTAVLGVPFFLVQLRRSR